MTQTIETLAHWYFTDCQARNLQVRTIEFYRGKLCYLVEALGSKAPEEVTIQELRALAVQLRTERQWSDQQTNHFIGVVRQFYHYLLNEELIDKNPAARFKKMRQERRLLDIPSKEDILRLLKLLPNDFKGIRDKTFMLCLLDTGIRLSEALGLTMENVDMQHLRLTVFGKGRKEAVVPFSTVLARTFAKYLPKRAKYAQCDALWVSRQGTPITLNYTTYMLHTYGDMAGIDHLHAHQFRHLFATEFLRGGGNPQMLQMILRHTSPVVTQRYLHLTDTDTAEAHKSASPLVRWKI